MTDYPLLAPVLALIGWTIVMLIWAIIFVTKGAKTVDLSAVPKGSRAKDLEGLMDPKFSFPRRNYEHLVEQPTIFYALALSLVFMGEQGMVALVLAWAYVGFRVLHSIAQANGKSRSIGFTGSSLALLALFIHAVMTFIG